MSRVRRRAKDKSGSSACFNRRIQPISCSVALLTWAFVCRLSACRTGAGANSRPRGGFVLRRQSNCPHRALGSDLSYGIERPFVLRPYASQPTCDNALRFCPPTSGGAVLVNCLAVGCGGFTTFSTFGAETLALFEQGHAGMAILYASLSLSLCLLAAFLGEILGCFLTSSQG